MGAYILKRLLLMIPTLFGIMLMTFAVIQFVPGGPIERIIAQVQGNEVDVTARIGGGSGSETGRTGDNAAAVGDQGLMVKYRGAQGLDPEFIKSLEKQFGFDKPAYERFFIMMKNYLTFNFGDSYFRDKSVVELMIEKMPVSISLGLWLTLITYAVSVPLGIRKAVKDGTNFDVWTSAVIMLHPRHHAGGAVLRRQLFQLVPVARAHLRQFRPDELARKDRRLCLASCVAIDRARHQRLRHHDASDQELLPR
jgi:microcin C transport system permease protein